MSPRLCAPDARLTHALWHIGQVAGGQAGARLATCLRMPTTRHTLLRLLRQQPVTEGEMLRVIGVDDWAKRRGQTYGTIVVDLERHRVVDLLPNRDAQTVRNWLTGRPSIQIVARDRSLEYTQGITSGAPQAIQVADRWHLLKNLSEAVERTLQDVLPVLLKYTTRQAGSGDRPRANFPRTQAENVKQLRSRQQRLETYSRIQVLKQHGYGIRRIARILGLSRGVVTRAYKADTFPERTVRYVPSQLDPYLDYLEQRIAEGCWNSQQLWREIGGRAILDGPPGHKVDAMATPKPAVGFTKVAETGAAPLPVACQHCRPVCTCLLPNQTAVRQRLIQWPGCGKSPPWSLSTASPNVLRR